MSEKLPPIGTPNYRGIASMEPPDIIRTREYWIVMLVQANRQNDSDNKQIAVDWIEALTSEMRVRGGVQAAGSGEVKLIA